MLIATKLAHSGAWEIVWMGDTRRTVRVYYGYTKREAIKLFKQEVNCD